MTQSIYSLRNMLSSRLVVMKKEMDYRQKNYTDIYVNEDNVIKLMQSRYDKAVEAYKILNDLVADGYSFDSDWCEADMFEED